MAFSENLKLLRTQKNFIQAELAKLVGVAQPTFAQYEMGIRVPTVIIGVKIAKKLDTTVEELVGGQTATAETVDEQSEVSS